MPSQMTSISDPPTQRETCPFDHNVVKVRLAADRCLGPQDLDLDDFPVVLGRSAQAGIQLRDRWVSRQHCELDLVDGELIVRDLGAKHGTYVNGQPVAEKRLRPGDEIRIGLTALTIVS